MASDVMSVRLWLRRIKVEEVVADAPEQLVVRVWSTVRRLGGAGRRSSPAAKVPGAGGR